MSEQKTAKIITVLNAQSSFPAKDGSGTWYKHGVIFEGSSDVWEYLTKTPTCTDFTSGQEATFTTEAGTNQNGYAFKKIKPVKANSGGGGKNFGGGKSFQKSPETEALIVLQSCFAAVCNLNAQSSTRDIKSIITDTNTAFEWMMEKAKRHVAPKPDVATTPVAKQPAAVSNPTPVAPPVVAQPAAPPTMDEDSDGLPF